MGVRECLTGKIEAGVLSPEQGGEFIDQIDARKQQNAGTVPEIDLESVSAIQAAKAAIEAGQFARFQQFKQMAAEIFVYQRMHDPRLVRKTFWKGELIDMTPQERGDSFFTRDVHDYLALGEGQQNIEGEYKAILGLTHTRMGKSIETMEASLIETARGQRRVASDDSVYAELTGKSTGNSAARFFVHGFRDGVDFLIDLYRAAGADLKKRADWVLPHVHDVRRVWEAGYERWREFTLPRLDRSKMLNDSGEPMDDAELDRMLKWSFDSIRTNGRAHLKAGETGRKMLGRSRTDSRQLHFTDQGWLEYNREFGRAGVIDTMIAYLDDLAMDTAIIRTLGPNPDKTVRLIKHYAEKLTDEYDRNGTRKAGYLRHQKGHEPGRKVQQLWDEFTGVATATDNPVRAQRFQAVRNFLTSSQLSGSSIAAAFGDPVTSAITRRFNGLSGLSALNGLARAIKESPDSRAAAMELGLHSEIGVVSASQASRYTDQVDSSGITRNIVNTVMRLNGVDRLTRTAQADFGYAVLMHAAKHAGRTRAEIAKVDKLFHRFLDRYGIDDQTWDLIRKAELDQHQGQIGSAPVMSLANIARLDHPDALDASIRFSQGIHTETDIGVLVPNARGKRIIHGSTQEGVQGELVKSLWMYKVHPIMYVLQHLYRAFASAQTTRLEKAQYVGYLMAASTISGAAMITAHDLLSGRDPRDMTSAQFWSEAFVRGGGAGFIGDAMNVFVNQGDRYGTREWYQYLTGPVVTVGEEAVGLITKPVAKAYDDGDFDLDTYFTELGAASVDFARWNTPGRGLPYIKAAFQRILMDSLDQMVDPRGARRRQRAMETYRKNQFDQQYWWQPGDTLPENTPDFTAILGQ